MIAMFILLITFVIHRLLIIKKETLVLRHQFRFYALRDNLRELAMTGKVQGSNWVFQYLDSSIVRSITVLGSLSVWRVILMMLFHRRNENESFTACQQQLRKELAKPENEPLQKIHLHYMGELGFFLFHRHSTIGVPIKSLFRAVKAGQFLKTQWRKAEAFLTETPETSTLRDFHSRKLA